jgi:hypothetical protein
MNMKKEYMIYIAIAVVVVIAVVGYLLLTSSGCALCGKPVSSSYLASMQQVAQNYTLANKVGEGIIVPGPYANIPKVINSTPLIVQGKPEVLFVGGDFCPYCAVTRWGLILALMRFGTFSNLTYMTSSSTDVYPNTLTFSFTNYSYRSNLVHLDAFEIFNRDSQNQTTPITTFDLDLYGRYSTGIPFIDFSNNSVQSGAVISPQLLHGYGYNEMLENLSNPNSPIAQAEIGQANLFTAYMCKSNATLNSTAAACQQGYVKQIIG